MSSRESYDLSYVTVTLGHVTGLPYNPKKDKGKYCVLRAHVGGGKLAKKQWKSGVADGEEPVFAQKFKIEAADWPPTAMLNVTVMSDCGLMGKAQDLGHVDICWPDNETGVTHKDWDLQGSKSKSTIQISVQCDKKGAMAVGGIDTKATGGLSNYDFGYVLGEGSYGKVVEVTRKSDQKMFAAKIIPSNFWQDVECEVDVMQIMDHVNCLNLEEMFTANKKMFMILELLRGSDLEKTVMEGKGPLTEREAAAVVRQIASALDYCHKQGIVHRDVKPENMIFVTEEKDSPVKLMDFGFASYKCGDSRGMKTACGSPSYVAPEICYQKHYGKEVDLYSLGVSLYQILTATLPFQHENVTQLYDLIKMGGADFQSGAWTYLSKPCRELVQGLMTLDPQRRLTCQQVLEHEWVKNPPDDQQYFASQAEAKHEEESAPPPPAPPGSDEDEAPPPPEPADPVLMPPPPPPPDDTEPPPPPAPE